MTEQLIAGDLDVAIVALPEVPDELYAFPLFEEEYVVSFPKDHRFRSLETVSIQELDGERYLSRINCEYLDVMQSCGASFDVSIDRRFQSENENWIQAMVNAGLGCSIMPQSLARSLEMHYRPLVSPTIKRTISVVTRRGRRHSPVVDVFVNLCKSLEWNNMLSPSAMGGAGQETGRVDLKP